MRTVVSYVVPSRIVFARAGHEDPDRLPLNRSMKARRALTDAKRRARRAEKIVTSQTPPTQRLVYIAEGIEAFAIDELDRAHDLLERLSGVSDAGNTMDAEPASGALKDDDASA